MPWDPWFPCWPIEPLGARSGVEDALPAWRTKKSSVRLVGTLGNSNARLVTQRLGHLAHHGRVPAADKYRGDRADAGFEPSIDTPLDTTQERLGRCDIVLTGKQKRNV